jgi:hypothetical protein
MPYFTEAELESFMLQSFASGIPTSAQVTALTTEISNRFDALMQQSVGSETPDEYVTQACLGAAAYVVGQHQAGEPIDAEKVDRLLRQFMVPIKKTSLYYEQAYPDSDGTW